MALDEPREDDTCARVAGVPFVIRQSEEAMVGSQRDIRVELLTSSQELYVATTLAAECLAWFESD